VNVHRLASGCAILSASTAYLVFRDHLLLLIIIPVVFAMLAWRFWRRRSIGLRWPASSVVLIAVVLIATMWLAVMAVVMSVAADVRERLPFTPEILMRAIPGNAPETMAIWLRGDVWVKPWTSLYLAGFTAVPLFALAWAVTRGARTTALLIVGSHASTFMLCLPIFIFLPIPDPWYGTGWWFGLPCPWWWQGMHQHLVTFCFPSLHMAVGTAVVLAMARCDRSPWARVSWWLWLVLLAASTIALRTHWLIDLPAGIAVGVIAHGLSLRLIRWQWRRTHQRFSTCAPA